MAEHTGFWLDAWRGLRRRPKFVIAAALILLILVVAAFPSLFTAADPTYADPSQSMLAPSAAHWFGTDLQGHDIYSRTVYGARASVTVGLGATLAVFVVGGALGALAGFYGSWIDAVVSRVTDVFLGLPLLLAAIVLMQVMHHRTVWTVIAILALFGWPQVARIARGAVLEVRASDYVLAAKALGLNRFQILLRHALPNAVGPVIAVATVALGIFIVTEATLSYLGVGLPTSVVSWGGDINVAQTRLRSGSPILFYPAGALAITVLAFMMMGDALRDALDPASGMAGMSVPAAPLLSVEGLEVTFGTDAPAVCGVDLAVRSGQTVAVVGESGSGKSTTAAAILGLLPAGGRITAGRVVFDGRDITGADAKRLRSIRGREIGYVPQDPMTNLNPVWKVGFQVTEALRANTDGRAARRRAVELLAEAGLPDPAKQAGRYPHQLSGGMCQRALIAIGLAGRPRLLIADEPTSALDVTVQRQVLDHLQGLTDELGTALLLITHDLALAAQRAEAVVVVRRGVVVESGAAQSILQSPQHEYTRRLVAAAPSLTARSRRPPESRSRATTQAGDILVVSELTKIYRESRGAPWRRVESRAVDGVSFRLPRASTLAIVGESGSGKSTLARMVLGLLQPTSGTVVFDGTYDVGALARDQVLAFRRRVQPVFQNPYSSLDPMYSVFRAIEEPLRVHHVGDRRQRQRAVRELVDQVALPSSILGRRPRELSGGQRQRVAIARALALRPEVLVCDEAVSALDVLVQAQILDLLADLQADLGLTYLFISHDLAVIRQIADDVLVMRAGRVVEHASTEEVFSRPRHEYTRQLLQAIPGAPSAPRKVGNL